MTRELTADQRERKRAADRRRAREHREHYAALRGQAVDRLVARGWDEESAVAEVYWVPIDVQRRRALIAHLRGQGYRGRGLDGLVRDAFHDELGRRIHAAEDACRGRLHSRRGYRLGVSTWDLFTANAASARVWASEELRRHWDEVGRLTAAEFRGLLVGDRAGLAASRSLTGTWAA